VPLLCNLLKDPAESVVLAAAEALGAVGDKRAVPHLEAAIERDPSPARVAVIGAFGIEPITGEAWVPKQKQGPRASGPNGLRGRTAKKKAKVSKKR
jgi:hypothetical protein